jgi:hypothetical protein
MYAQRCLQFYFKPSSGNVLCCHILWSGRLSKRTARTTLSLTQRTTLNPLQTKTIKCRQSLGRSERLLQNTPFLDRYPLWPGCRNGIPDEGVFDQRAARMSRISSQVRQSERYPIRRFVSLYPEWSCGGRHELPRRRELRARRFALLNPMLWECCGGERSK